MESFYERSQIREFEKNILAAGECDSFLPMSFTEVEQTLRVIYYLEGYEKIGREHIKNPYQLLKMIEKVVLNMKKAENHFLLYERYLIDLDCIYINSGIEDVKLLFVPEAELIDALERPNKGFAEKLVEFLEEIKGGTEETRGKEYIEMLLLKMKRLNLSKQGIINYIGELKREAYICGWE